MNKKGVGLLFGAAVGAALVWLIRQREIDLFGRKRQIRLDEKGTTCSVVGKPEEVWLVSNQRLTWEVTNDCDRDIRVSLENWREQKVNKAEGEPAVDPDPDPDDHDEPPQHGLSRVVPAHKKRKIRSKAKLAAYPLQTFEYDVYLDGVIGADPIVRLVL
jgi:hypothetical protein